jgi:hypothetical protein
MVEFEQTVSVEPVAQATPGPVNGDRSHELRFLQITKAGLLPFGLSLSKPCEPFDKLRANG